MKLITHTTRVAAILSIILGIIHCAYTPSILKEIPLEIHRPFTFIFLLAGIAIIYMGLVLLYELRSLKAGSKTVSMITGTHGLITLTGLAGVYYMPENPFTWIILVIGVLAVSLVTGAQINIKKQIQTTS